MTNTLTTTGRNIDEIIREIKNYEELAEQLKSEVEALRLEAIEFLRNNDRDEYTCDDGKITYREVISNRFASTEFKKVHLDLYEAFLRRTTSMRFTCC